MHRWIECGMGVKQEDSKLHNFFPFNLLHALTLFWSLPRSIPKVYMQCLFHDKKWNAFRAFIFLSCHVEAEPLSNTNKQNLSLRFPSRSVPVCCWNLLFLQARTMGMFFFFFSSQTWKHLFLKTSLCFYFSINRTVCDPAVKRKTCVSFL